MTIGPIIIARYQNEGMAGSLKRVSSLCVNSIITTGPAPFYVSYMHDKGQVWFASLEDIAAHVQRVVADGTWTPRVDHLPYYDGPIPELGPATSMLAQPR